MKLLFLALAYLFIIPASAQKITGKVIDSESKIPIDYVNIGITRKNKGTVSDKNGHFSIKLISDDYEDSLKISARGYQTASYAVQDIKRIFQESKGKLLIELTKKNAILTKIAFNPLSFEREVIGNKGRFKPMTVKYKSLTTTKFNSIYHKSGYRLNKEVGTVMKIKKAPAVIQDVNFIINSSNYLNNIPLRVNIYTVKKELPEDIIFSEPIFTSKKIKKGILSINLEKYNIYVEDDFLVALEWNEEPGGKSIGFGAGMFNQDSFHRNAAQHWEKVPLLGLGFYTTVMYLK